MRHQLELDNAQFSNLVTYRAEPRAFYNNIYGSSNLDNQLSTNVTGKTAQEQKEQDAYLKTLTQSATTAHAKSGSGRPLMDWLKSEDAKKALGTGIDTLNKYIAQKNGVPPQSSPDTTTYSNDTLPPLDDTKSETEIFGMPVWAVALGGTAILVGGFFGVRYLIKNSNTTKK